MFCEEGVPVDTMPTKVYIRTFGCQMNKRDSEILAGALRRRGAELVDDWEDADVVLFNTCAVRKHAEDRVFSILGLLAKSARSRGQRKVFGLLGCMAEEWKGDAFKKAPYLDLVCGPNDLYTLVEHLEDIVSAKRRWAFVGGERRSDEFYSRGAYFTVPTGESTEPTFVIVMEGCDNFCSYCIVPYVRGRERSRPWRDVVEEVRMLVSAGRFSFMLLGQNVNSYAGGMDFPDLLDRVARIEGVRELSFATSHPKDAHRRLFEVMASHENIRPYLHLPMQSGSDRILRAMNRGYTYEEYLEKIATYRALVPNGYLSTDIIVGFPGETEEDFLKTRRALEEIRFDNAYIFKYSPRPFTKASSLKDDVPLKEKERRHQELLTLQKRLSAARRPSN